MISGTLCGGQVQGTFAQKEMNCLKCEVYKRYNLRTGMDKGQLIKEYRSELAEYIDGDVEGLAGQTNEEALELLTAGMEATLEEQIQARTHELLVINRQLKEEIEERKRAEKTIRHMAYYDTLTELPNRVMLEERLKAEISRAERGGESFAVLFVDLDRFKTINDTLGHGAGDLLLKSVAQRLRKCLRQYDVLSRFGGDEFVILLPRITNPKHVSMVARRIVETLKIPFKLESRKLYITLSIGIAHYPQDSKDHGTLLKYADIAMYKAKDLGRNNFQFYEPAMNVRLMQFAKLEGSLAEALDREELRLEYQPQIDINNGNLSGVEALIRWDHPEFGLVSPADFIPLAEETGLIIPIGEWVLRTACSQNVAWQQAGYRAVRMAVNLSARQFRQKTLQEMVVRILDDTGLDPQWLDLEITESEIMQDTANAVAVLRDLRGRGVNISLDDFGTGYSSLNYLKMLPVNIVKIDRAFVRNLAANDEDAAIAKAIISMAHTLRLKVIAEGVETRDQLDLLRSFGCDLYQGFLFSRPVRPGKLTVFFSDISEDTACAGRRRAGQRGDAAPVVICP